MTETKPIVVYTADCVGNAANCRYPNEVKITDEVSAKQAFATDMVCARYKTTTAAPQILRLPMRCPETVTMTTQR